MPQFLLVSKVEPVEREGVTIQTKPYTPEITEGERFAFYLTANPVVSRKTEGKKKSVKHDVWMDAKKRATDSGVDKISIVKACEDASKKWLVNQGEKGGFFVTENDFVVDGYMQNRIYKKHQKVPIQFSSIKYEGALTVTNPDKFLPVLYTGLGRAKAFGCGLLLIRRA